MLLFSLHIPDLKKYSLCHIVACWTQQLGTALITFCVQTCHFSVELFLLSQEWNYQVERDECFNSSGAVLPNFFPKTLC